MKDLDKPIEFRSWTLLEKVHYGPAQEGPSATRPRPRTLTWKRRERDGAPCSGPKGVAIGPKVLGPEARGQYGYMCAQDPWKHDPKHTPTTPDVYYVLFQTRFSLFS